MPLKPRYPYLNRQHPLARGLALSWLFHEAGGGVIHDVTGNGYDGSLTGNWAIAPAGSGVKTDGSTTEVGRFSSTTPIPSPNVMTGDFTVALRFTVSTLGSYTPVFDFYDAQSGRMLSLFLNAGGGTNSVYWAVGGNVGSDSISIGTALAANTWYDLVVTRRGTLSSFYVNGKLGGTDSTQTSTTAWSGTGWNKTVSLGLNPSTGGTKEPFIYDYFSLWSRALTPGEVEEFGHDPFAIYRQQWRRRVKGVAAAARTPYNPWPLAAPILAQ